MTQELKPCPFCGGKAETIENAVGTLFWVYCRSCGARSDSYTTEYRQKAIDAWNTRAERTCRNISDPPSGFYCSVCHWGDWGEPSHLLTGSKYTGRVNGGPNYCPNCGAKVVEE